MEPQTIILLVGLGFNFVAMIVGGLGFAFGIWRWFSRLEVALVQRITKVETEVHQLMRAQGCGRREGEGGLDLESRVASGV
jgi:hypothetical protein